MSSLVFLHFKQDPQEREVGIRSHLDSLDCGCPDVVALSAQSFGSKEDSRTGGCAALQNAREAYSPVW